MVGSSGVEPPTSCLSGMRSNLLSYEPVLFAQSPEFTPVRRPFLWTTSRFLSTDGGDEGIRTLDPLLAGQVLSQLSYTPILIGNSQPHFPKENATAKVYFDCGPWKSNNNDKSELRSSSSVLFLCELRVIFFQSLMFSIERRWSSRTFRYGYLVTT